MIRIHPIPHDIARFSRTLGKALTSVDRLKSKRDVLDAFFLDLLRVLMSRLPKHGDIPALVLRQDARGLDLDFAFVVFNNDLPALILAFLAAASAFLGCKSCMLGDGDCDYALAVAHFCEENDLPCNRFCEESTTLATRDCGDSVPASDLRLGPCALGYIGPFAAPST